MQRLLLSTRAWMLTLTAGLLLTANSCLPQDYFASLAGDVVSQTASEILSRAIATLLDAGVAA